LNARLKDKIGHNQILKANSVVLVEMIQQLNIINSGYFKLQNDLCQQSYGSKGLGGSRRRKPNFRSSLL